MKGSPPTNDENRFMSYFFLIGTLTIFYVMYGFDLSNLSIFCKIKNVDLINQAPTQDKSNPYRIDYLISKIYGKNLKERTKNEG